jgi:hypothetical protein
MIAIWEKFYHHDTKQKSSVLKLIENVSKILVGTALRNGINVRNEIRRRVNSETACFCPSCFLKHCILKCTEQ